MRRFNNIIPMLLALIFLFAGHISSNDDIQPNMKLSTCCSNSQNLEKRLLLSVSKEMNMLSSNTAIDSTMAYFLRLRNSMRYIVEFIRGSTRTYRYEYSRPYEYYYDLVIYPMLYIRYGSVESITVDTKYFDVELNPPSITLNYIPFDSMNQYWRISCK